MAVAAGEARLLPGVVQDLGRQHRLDWQETPLDTLVKAASGRATASATQRWPALCAARRRPAAGWPGRTTTPAAPLGEAAKEMARKAGDVATVKQAVVVLKDVA